MQTRFRIIAAVLMASTAISSAAFAESGETAQAQDSVPSIEEILAAAGKGTAGGEKIEDVLANAYNSNPTLLARRARVRSNDELVPQALSNWRPTVAITADAGRTKTVSNTFTPRYSSQIRNPHSIGVSLTQPLYRGGRTMAATDQAENTVMSERALLDVTEQSILLNTATAYMNVVRDQAVVQLNINNEQVLRRQLEAAQERFRVGELTRTDVSQAEARYSLATADRVQAEGNLQASRATYQNIVGRPSESLSPPGPLKNLPTSLEEAMARATAENPNVVSTEFTHRAAEAAVDLIRGELLPSVALVTSLERSDNAAGIDTRSDTMTAIVNLTVPIYQSGSEYSRLRQQKHVSGQRRIESDQAKRDAAEAASQAWEAVVTARARKRSYAAQIKASELALAGVEEEAKVGSRTILDVLDAEQELFNARVNLVRSQRDELVAAYQLKSAVGEMTAKSLALPVELYDPAQHYEDVRGKWIGTEIDPVTPRK